MDSIKNHFAIDKNTSGYYGVETGDYTIQDGGMEVLNTYVAGQYIYIKGSTLNDGAYRVEAFKDGIVSFRPNLTDYPNWVKPTGAGNAYKTGDKVLHNNHRWLCLQDINIIEPGYPGTTGEWWEEIAGNEIQDPMTDEYFTNGTIYSLRVPYDFIEAVKNITEFTTSSEGKQDNIASASFGIQSVSYATGVDGMKAGWQTVFNKTLSKWRRMHSDI